MFRCSKCGLCCKYAIRLPLFRHLDDGSGKCRYFDKVTKLCKIYENRPIVCNVDKMYESYFLNQYTREEFYELNYKACRLMQEKEEA